MKSKNEDICNVIWETEDVIEVRPDLSREQARQVLRLFERRHDATIGINWDVIEYWAENEFPLQSREAK